jgi:hypothetical protein
MAEESPRATTPSLLADISNRLSVIEARLEIIADHETRIRDLEKARWQSAWITSTATALATSALVTLIMKGI